MKLQTTLVASLFACVQYMSAQSNLVIFSQDGHRFYLLVDGVQQNNTPQSNIKINGLPHNACKVKVVFENNTLTTVDKTIYFSPDEDLEYVYNLKADKHNKMQLRPLTHNSIASSPNNTTNQTVYVYGSPANNTPAPVVANTNVGSNTTTTTVTTTEVRETSTNSNTTPANGNITMNTNMGTTGDNANVNVNVSGSDVDNTNVSNGNANITISMGMGAAGGGVNVSVTDTDGTNENINMGINTTITDPNMNNGGIDMGVNTTVTDNGNYSNTWGNGNSTNTTTTTTNNNGTITSTTVTTTSTTTTTTSGSAGTAYPNSGNNGTYNNSNTTYNTNTNYGSSNNATYAYATANGCYMPLGDSDFNRLRSSVDGKPFDDERLIIAKQALTNSCMTSLQIKDLMSEMSFDKSRIEFAKYAYPNCIDPQNYFQVNDAFQFGASAADLDKALANSPRPANPAYSNGGATMAKPTAAGDNHCFTAMSGADYSRLQSSVKSKSFGKDQVAIGKQAVQSNCLTAEQIKGIMKIMSFDDSRLEFAQLAYPNCIDKQNFYQVNDAFAFPSSVEKLNKALGL